MCLCAWSYFLWVLQVCSPTGLQALVEGEVSLLFLCRETNKRTNERPAFSLQKLLLDGHSRVGFARLCAPLTVTRVSTTKAVDDPRHADAAKHWHALCCLCRFFCLGSLLYSTRSGGGFLEGASPQTNASASKRPQCSNDAFGERRCLIDFFKTLEPGELRNLKTTLVRRLSWI